MSGTGVAIVSAAVVIATLIAVAVSLGALARQVALALNKDKTLAKEAPTGAWFAARSPPRPPSRPPA